MKVNKWTLGLAAAGVVSLGSVAYAEEKPMSQVLTGVSGTQLGGYVDASAIWNTGTGNANLPGRAFDGVGKLDGFNLNVVDVTLQKVPGEDNWAAGFRTDLLFGPDAVGYDLSVGNNGLVSNNSDFGIKQAYVDLVLPVGSGWDFKLGTFNSIVGYEVFESYKNPNYSRSYGWQLEPSQHTGLLTSYEFAEGFSLTGGIANTYMAGVNTRSGRDIESQKAYMASLGLTAPESWGVMAGSGLYAGFVTGFDANTKNTALYYVGATIKTGVEGFSFGAAFDYRENGPSTVTTGDTWAWAAAGYLTYAATEHLKFIGRLDFTKGTDGTWYDIDGDGVVTKENKLVSATGTIQYDLWANVISRLEIRWDHSASGDEAFGGEVAGDPTDENAVTVAANVVYVF